MRGRGEGAGRGFGHGEGGAMACKGAMPLGLGGGRGVRRVGRRERVGRWVPSGDDGVWVQEPGVARMAAGRRRFGCHGIGGTAAWGVVGPGGQRAEGVAGG